jgi:hypothetical protein
LYLEDFPNFEVPVVHRVKVPEVLHELLQVADGNDVHDIVRVLELEEGLPVVGARHGGNPKEAIQKKNMNKR